MLYVAYGSNLNKAQMKKRCPKATIAGTGTAPDHDLVFNTVATLHEKENAHTPVALWNMSDEDEKIMDVYEGFPHKYHKEQITVRLDNGRTVIGVAYIMNDTKHQAIPKDEYYNRIERGYRDFGFALDKLENAYDRSVEYEVNHRQVTFWDLPSQTKNSKSIVEDDGYCVFGKGITNEDCDLLYRGFIVGKWCANNCVELSMDEIKDLTKELSKSFDEMSSYDDIDFETFVDDYMFDSESMYLSEEYAEEQNMIRGSWQQYSNPSYKPPKAEYYAAYGSNMNLPQMAYRCPNSHEDNVGYAVDYKLEFCNYANIKSEENAVTPVLLWKIDPRDWESLDMYEGYPSLYRRKEIDVDVNGERVKALAYIMNDNQRTLHMPSEFYINNMLNDYKRLGIDPTPIAEAMEDVMQARNKQEQQRAAQLDSTPKNRPQPQPQGRKV